MPLGEAIMAAQNMNGLSEISRPSGAINQAYLFIIIFIHQKKPAVSK